MRDLAEAVARLAAGPDSPVDVLPRIPAAAAPTPGTCGDGELLATFVTTIRICCD